jgi:hypothetical protein
MTLVRQIEKGCNVHVGRISAIAFFRFSEGRDGELVANNYVVTAYQKEIG